MASYKITEWNDDEMLSRIRTLVKEGLREAVDDGINLAKPLTPVDTGALVNSIHALPPTDESELRVVTAYGAGAWIPYAMKQERIHRYIGRSFDDIAPLIPHYIESQNPGLYQ